MRRTDADVARSPGTHRRSRAARSGVILLVLLATVTLDAQSARPGQQPARDTPPRTTASAQTPTPEGRIAGRVVAADTGRPVARARVLVTGTAVPGGRGAQTDNDGLFDIGDLPAGRYTLTAGKPGFLTIAYGQRRPLQAGTPIELDAGQRLSGLAVRLPRGSVISGHLFDEAGEPTAGAAIRVLRFEYAQGTRQLIPVGTAQTDDLGAFRVWGLNPGQYYVTAAVSGGAWRGAGAGAVGRGGRSGRPAGAASAASSDAESIGYAPTFYPGAPSLAEARPITVGLSTEVSGLDFGILVVRTARVSGRVTNPDGTPTTSGMVFLTMDGGVTAQAPRALPGGTFGARVDWDGSFSIPAVPPGRYLLRARGDDTVDPQFATLAVAVTGTDVADLPVVLAPGATISGAVMFEGQDTPDPSMLRLAAPFADAASAGPNTTARIERNGHFTLGQVQAGSHLLRVQGSPRGWTVKSVTLDGRDITDVPFEVRAGQALAGIRVTFTDRLTEIAGMIRDDRGAPSIDQTVLAFPTNDALWRPLSRHIGTARPDQNGRFQLRGLPPGEYFVVAVDPLEQGEWFEPAFLEAHRAGARRVALVEGDLKTQDLTVSNR